MTVIHLRRSLDDESNVLSGWLVRFAQERGWELKTVLYADALPRDQEIRTSAGLGRMVRSLVSTFDPAGFIVEYNPTRRIPSAAFGNRPVVYVDCDRESLARNEGRVAPDDASLAESAAKELLSLGFPQCAYVHWFTRPSWSRLREEAFRRLARGKGVGYRTFRCPRAEQDRVPAIGRWIASLPKPCAVFAVNDTIARYVADACSVVGVAVPSEVAIIGVDNRVVYCERGPVTLSSVAVDHHAEVSAACEMLARMMSGRQVARVARYGAGAVIRRASTRALRRKDSVAEKAAEYIRLHAAERIGVRETAAAVGCSPATLQRRFAAALGHGVGEEIADVRFELARRFLSAPDCEIAAVANRCGYDSDSTLRYAFKARLGMSPRAFRDGESTA